MAKFTVAQIDALRDIDGLLASELAKADAALIKNVCKTDDEVIAFAKDVDGMICTSLQTGEKIFANCPRVQVIVRTGIGFDNIDLEAATRHNVVVCNVTDYGINEVATHAVSLILALNRKLVLHNNAARRGERVPLGPSGKLIGETLGLVAFGNIAQAVADRAQAFGLSVIAFDPYADPQVAAAKGVELTTLDDLMARADYVSVHAPLNEETHGLVGAHELSLMKPTAYLVTTCRGGVVAEAALYDALKAGTIAGAGIDVWDPEPVRPGNPLLEFENVIATPHSAFYSDVSIKLLYQRSGEAAADVLRGYLPRSVVNKEVLAKVKLQAHPGRA